MNIRLTKDQETVAIRELVLDAFDDEEASTVAQLALELLKDPASQALSVGAYDGDKLIGYALFTSVRLDSAENLSAYIMAPVAVSSDQQGTGIGQAVIAEGLDRLREQGVAFVMVYGDPNYYSRSGFHVQNAIKAPYELAFPHGWQAQALQPGALEGLAGTLRCAGPLMNPEHW